MCWFFGFAGIFRLCGGAPVPEQGRTITNTTASPPDNADEVSYAPPEFEWSGTTTGALPLKILTYKQYECLEDARYGFRIVGLLPSDLRQTQTHQTRAHGHETVASLYKHGFLYDDGSGRCVITDHEFNALEICSVRY